MTGSQSREPALKAYEGPVFSGELGGTADGSKPLPQIWGRGFFIHVTEEIHARKQATSQDNERGADNGKGSEER